MKEEEEKYLEEKNEDLVIDPEMEPKDAALIKKQ